MKPMDHNFAFKWDIRYVDDDDEWFVVNSYKL